MEWMVAIRCQATLLAVFVMPTVATATDQIDAIADEEITIVERSDRLIGIAENATEGILGAR